jgi:hypothetical protein
MRIHKFSIAAAVLVLAGCGQAGQQAQQDLQQGAAKAAAGAQQAQQGANPQAVQQGQQSLAQGLAQMAQGLKAAQTDANGKPITVVDFDKLIALLPQPSGWERSKPEGTQTSSPFVTSQASANYTKGNFHANVTITDSALNSMVMMPFTMMMSMNYSERSTSGYKKSLQYDGQPGLEEWNSDNHHGEMTMIVNKRYVVVVKGDGFDSMDALKEISNGLDLKKLAALQ